MAGEPTNAVMNPFKLTDEEISNELDIRGVQHVITTIREKADLLYHHMLDPHLTERIEMCNPRVEYVILKAKVGELEALFAEGKHAGTLDDSGRYASLFIHTVFRIRRTMFRAQELYEDFVGLAKKIVKLHKKTNKKLPWVQFPSLHVPGESSEEDLAEQLEQINLNQSGSGKSMNSEKSRYSDNSKKSKKSGKLESDSDSTSAPSEVSKPSKRRHKRGKRTKHRKKEGGRSDSESSSSDSSSSRNAHKTRARQRNNPVTNWKMEYEKGNKLHSFLTEVEEQADMHNVSDEELLRGIGALLDGAARQWYRINRETIVTFASSKDASRLHSLQQKMMTKS